MISAILRHGQMRWVKIAISALLVAIACPSVINLATGARPAPAKATVLPLKPKSDQPLIQQAAVIRASIETYRSGSVMDAVLAEQINARVPISQAINPPAKPFVISGSPANRALALQCLTYAIYYEAARESVQGQRAVAQVVLNRVRHPAYPDSVCGVVFEGSQRVTGCQFSFTCDGAMAWAPEPQLWRKAMAVALAALEGYVEPSVGGATHYHASYVFPYWAPSLTKVAKIGAHIFYRWNGAWGLPAVFTANYAGGELIPPYRTTPAVQMLAEAEPINIISHDMVGDPGAGAERSALDAGVDASEPPKAVELAAIDAPALIVQPPPVVVPEPAAARPAPRLATATW